MNTPLVTIAIPIYNAEPYLCDAIQSVINQTYKDWLLYLINDGSTDNSLSIMKEYAKRDCRIKIINDGQNKGLIARLNQSISLSETKYYARMDADDIMYIYRIEEQIKFLEEHHDIDICGTSIMTIDNDNNIIGSGYYDGNVSSFVHPSVIGKTIWFKNNPYAEWPVRAEDFELWLRTANKSKFYAIGKPLLFYREFGIPTFSKYYATQQTMLKIFINYRMYGQSLLWCSKNIVKTVTKIIVSAFLGLIGRDNLLVYFRRRHSIPKELCLNSDDLLSSIKNV